MLNAKLLYATSARIGGSGLDSVALESLRASHRAGFLKRAIAFDNRQREIPSALIRSLRASGAAAFVSRQAALLRREEALPRLDLGTGTVARRLHDFSRLVGRVCAHVARGVSSRHSLAD